MEGLSKYTHLTSNNSLSYENQFNDHNISALALLEITERDGKNFAAYGYGFDILELDELNFATLEDKTRVSGGSYTQKMMVFVSRINYDCASRYMAEVSFRYDGSYVFGGMNQRWSAFPAASVGWRISEESWFKNLDTVNNLKLRGSLVNFYNTADRAGNILICNLAPNDGAFKIWKMASVEAPPELMIEWDGDVPIGRKMSVQDNINGDYFVASYSGNTFAWIDGTTNEVSKMLESISVNYIQNAMDYVEFKNAQYTTVNWITSFTWGTADKVWLLDVSFVFTF